MKPTRQTNYEEKFDAYRVAAEVVRELREPVSEIRRQSFSLADQLERAATSVVLNLAEGRRRFGGDRRHLFRIASGSAAEVRAALEVAEALGYLGTAQLGPVRGLLDRVCAMTWRLAR